MVTMKNTTIRLFSDILKEVWRNPKGDGKKKDDCPNLKGFRKNKQNPTLVG